MSVAEDDENLWKQYMEKKKSKLLYQINSLERVESISKIFEGISIFINGYTNPPAAELRRLIQLHGGEYHSYYQYGSTTCTIATHIANSKVRKLRKSEKIVHPRWILESIATGKKLDESKYTIYNKSATINSPLKFSSRTEKAANAANDPNFIKNFYERSRLHLISTLAQDMKQFVSELRSRSNHEFVSRNRLCHLRSADSIEDTLPETICHIDMDCFFVSVALISRPDLIGKPVVVTHSKDQTDNAAGMSEIASCSYEARLYGVRNGWTVKAAKKCCPDIICTPYQFHEYRRLSRLIYTIVSRYTLDIRAVSCDELYVDLQSLCSELCISNIEDVVSIIREEIFEETKCHASVGIGSNLLLARLATRHAKPKGKFIVKRNAMEVFISNEKVSSLPGIGYSIHRKIRDSFGNIQLCGELQKVELKCLQEALGKKIGSQVYNFCRGSDDNRSFFAQSERRSVSCDINYGIRFKEEDELNKFLFSLAQELEKKLDVIGRLASSVTVRLLIRMENAPFEPEKFMGHGSCNIINRSALFPKPMSSALLIVDQTKKLISKINPVISDIRGIGIQLSKLSKSDTSRANRISYTLTQCFKRASGDSWNESGQKKKLVFGKSSSLQEVPKRRPRMVRRTATFVNLEPKLDLCFCGHFDELSVKAEMLRMMKFHEDPTEDIAVLLTGYFYNHLKSGGSSRINIIGIFRFLERIAIECSLKWSIAIANLKRLLNNQCYRLHGYKFAV